jgi:hypothetical protein
MGEENKQKAKAELLDELKSISGLLNEEETDDIPMLGEGGEDDDIPMLDSSDDDDIPVLASDEPSSELDEASLQEAMAKLESMDLSPKLRKNKNTGEQQTPPEEGANENEEHQTEMDLGNSLIDKIRANAQPPIYRQDEEKSEENPFLNRDTLEKLEQTKRAAAEAKAARAIPQEEPTETIEEIEEEEARSLDDELDDIPFVDDSAEETTPEEPATEEPNEAPSVRAALEARKKEANQNKKEDHAKSIQEMAARISQTRKKKPAPAPGQEKEQSKDASEELLKALDEDSAGSPSSPSRPSDEAMQEVIDGIVDEYIILLENALMAKVKECVNALADEVAEDYHDILEAAMRKKLQELMKKS